MKKLLSIALVFLLFSFSKNQKPKFAVRFKTPKILKQSWNDFDRTFIPKKGETIADVGAQEPSLAFYLLGKYDSITVVTQDIDTSFISDYKINVIKNLYGKYDKKYLTMKIPFVLGDKNSTNLSKNYFDAILLTRVYHEFSFKSATINDLSACLKKNGKLYVTEDIATEKGIKRTDCENDYVLEEDLVRDFIAGNFLFEEENELSTTTDFLGKGNKIETKQVVFIFKKK